MNPGVSELEARVRAALAPVDAIRVAYLFGSRGRGDARHDSDLDIAVVFARTADDETHDRARRDVLVALTDALGLLGESADIVDLENADSAVAFRAIREGRRVLARSESERVRIETRVARRYDDDLPKRVLFRRAAREAVARMGVPRAVRGA